MSKLADVRYGPATKGKRSVHSHMQQGRIDLMFHDQANAQVSLQFDEKQLSAGEDRDLALSPDSGWFEKLQAEKIAMLLTVGFKALHSKKWFSASPDQMTYDQQQAKAEAAQVDYWMLETHRAMCKLLNIPVEESVMQGLADGASTSGVSKDLSPSDATVVMLSQKTPNSDFEAAARLVIARELWPYSRATLLGELQDHLLCPIVAAVKAPATRGRVVALACICKDELAEDISHAAGCVAAEFRHWAVVQPLEGRCLT